MITLRPALINEKEIVLSLYKSVIGLEGSVWDDEYPTMDEINTDFDHNCLYVLEKDGTVIGAISPLYENICDEFDCWQISDGTQREFARVVIGRDYQGHGYGALMTQMLLDIFKKDGCNSVHGSFDPYHGQPHSESRCPHPAFHRLDCVHRRMGVQRLLE